MGECQKIKALETFSGAVGVSPWVSINLLTFKNQMGGSGLIEANIYTIGGGRPWIHSDIELKLPRCQCVWIINKKSNAFKGIREISGIFGKLIRKTEIVR
jgi:hypothetical protein